MKKAYVVAFVVSCGLMSALSISAQRKARLGRVCGDPTIKCKGEEGFQPHNLPFDTGKNSVIAESERFYAVILRSVKIKEFGDCAKPSFPEAERVELQKLFVHNKVFAYNCLDGAGDQYFLGVSEHVAFVAVYAGRTLTEAKAFLDTVNATGKFQGAAIKRLQAEINGT